MPSPTKPITTGRNILTTLLPAATGNMTIRKGKVSEKNQLIKFQMPKSTKAMNTVPETQVCNQVK